MAAREPAPPPKKASGENIEEWQRSGTKVQFRLTAAEAKALEQAATVLRLTPNALAAQMVRLARRSAARPDG